MDRWVGKVAVVSGASSGIGAAIAKDLAKSGMIVIGLARRAEIIDQLWHTLKSENPEITGTIHSFKCDISLDTDVKAAFQWIDEKFGRVDVMINNAAVFIQGNLVDADNSMKLLDTINTNVFGVAICTREAFQLMQKHQINDGHVIIINSGAGHSVPSAFTEIGSMNMYSPSKYAARAMTEVLRQEFQLLKTKIKITSISPGLVDTPAIKPEFMEYFKRIGAGCLQSEDLSQAVLYVLGTPPHVQIHELTINPLAM